MPYGMPMKKKRMVECLRFLAAASCYRMEKDSESVCKRLYFRTLAYKCQKHENRADRCMEAAQKGKMEYDRDGLRTDGN